MFKTLNKPGTGVDKRTVMTQTLLKMMESDDRIAVLDADLASASGLAKIREVYPDRFFDCGIQEANMVGTAAGMSEGGVIPFTHTFGCFASRKCIDQIFLSACYAGLNVKMIGTDPGVTAATNGGSHQGMEDMGTLISMNNITLVDATDSVMLADLLPKLKDRYGVCYIRVYRRDTEQIYEEGSTFEIGKGNVIREGTDATIIASGIEVAESMKAADLLAEEGIHVRIVDMFTWRPLDEELVIRCARETGCIVTAENHTLASGLGRAVSGVVVKNCPVPMEFIGIDDQFGEVGDLNFLKKRFHLTAEDIVCKVKAAIARKEGSHA